MEININQKKISIGEKYKIFIDGIETHTAAKKLFNFLAVVFLSANHDMVPHVTIRRRFSWFKAKYDIERNNNSIVEFRTKSYWKGHYQCNNGKDFFDVYGHRGRKYSIYKNNVQIAWWNKSAVSWFAGDNYKVVADKDCDSELIISFCLIIDNFKHSGNKSTVNIDFGNIGFQAMKFDKSWQPKF